MPDPRPDDQRNRVHDLILANKSPDKTYAKGISNAQKVEFICGVLAHRPSAFDLELPFPLEDWIASDDNSLVCAGLYLNDLRLQFYQALALDEAKDESVFVRVGEAEFWHFAFNRQVNRRLNGVLMQDGRALQ